MAVAVVDHGCTSMEEAVVAAVVVWAAWEYRDRDQARFHRHPAVSQETAVPWWCPRVQASAQVIILSLPGQFYFRSRALELFSMLLCPSVRTNTGGDDDDEARRNCLWPEGGSYVVRRMCVLLLIVMHH